MSTLSISIPFSPPFCIQSSSHLGLFWAMSVALARVRGVLFWMFGGEQGFGEATPDLERTDGGEMGM